MGRLIRIVHTGGRVDGSAARDLLEPAPKLEGEQDSGSDEEEPRVPETDRRDLTASEGKAVTNKMRTNAITTFRRHQRFATGRVAVALTLLSESANAAIASITDSRVVENSS
jgi:hypothetical protein